jgi:hypothetical protein
MPLRNPGLCKTFTAGSDIGANGRFVKFGSDDQTVVVATAASDPIIGVSDVLAVASGERVDVFMNGIATITYGGTVTRGALLISDSTGRGIAATAAAGTNVRTGGTAMESGVVGDASGSVNVVPGSFQG